MTKYNNVCWNPFLHEPIIFVSSKNKTKRDIDQKEKKNEQNKKIKAMCIVSKLFLDHGYPKSNNQTYCLRLVVDYKK